MKGHHSVNLPAIADHAPPHLIPLRGLKLSDSTGSTVYLKAAECWFRLRCETEPDWGCRVNFTLSTYLLSFLSSWPAESLLSWWALLSRRQLRSQWLQVLPREIQVQLLHFIVMSDHFLISCHCERQFSLMHGYSKCCMKAELSVHEANCKWRKWREMCKCRNWCIPLGHLVLLVLQPVQVKGEKQRKAVSYLLSLKSCKRSIRGHVGVLDLNTMRCRPNAKAFI